MYAFDAMLSHIQLHANFSLCFQVESFIQLLYAKDAEDWRIYMGMPGKTEEWMVKGMRPGRPEYLTNEVRRLVYSKSVFD